MPNEIMAFKTDQDLKMVLANQYQKQINNFFGDEKKALCFLSGVCAAVQRNPKLLNCAPMSVINSFMTMAQLELMPSDVSGEAYVIPYGQVAQFQLGYKGLVTLLYRSGLKDIVAEIVRENDQFSYENGKVSHKIDFFGGDRGEAIGAYVIARLGTGGEVNKVMSKDEILAIAKKFSKSYNSKESPWSEEKDPEKWMWKKTVLIQLSKLVPKNDKIIHAIGEDYKDSNIGKKLAVEDPAESLKMGALLIETKPKKNGKTTKPEAAEAEEGGGEEVVLDEEAEGRIAG